MKNLKDFFIFQCFLYPRTLVGYSIKKIIESVVVLFKKLWTITFYTKSITLSECSVDINLNRGHEPELCNESRKMNIIGFEWFFTIT